MILNKQNLKNNLWFGENSHKSAQYAAVAQPDSIIPDPSRVWGIDISHWNGLTDLATAKGNGCSFVIIKACDGSVPTKWFAENKQRAKDAPLVWGAYMWLYPNTKVSIDAQVTAWWNLVRNDYPPLGVFIDVEWTTYAGIAANPNTADANMALDKFRAISGRTSRIYTAKGYTDTYLKGFTRYDEFGLWVANYGVTVPLLPVGATTHKFHQFTSSLPGWIAPSNNLSLDGNYYKGTAVEFEREFGGATLPPPPPPVVIPPTGETNMLTCKTLVQVKVFNSIAANAAQVRLIGAGVTFNALSQTGDWLMISTSEWVNIYKGGTLAVQVTAPPPPPPPPPTKTLTNLIHVYNDGSVDVLPQ